VVCIGVMLGSVATAQEDSPWWLGLEVSQVTLEAPVGGLPSDNIGPLLRVVQGDIYSPSAVASDLRLLYGLGMFEAVEADVSPWVGFSDGGYLDQVNITYRIYPGPVLSSVTVTGASFFTERELLTVTGLQIGERVLLERARSNAVAELEALYREAGFPLVTVGVGANEGTDSVSLTLVITEGGPRILTSLEFSGITRELSDRELGRIASSAGVEIGTPFTEIDLENMRGAVEDALEERGWYSARVVALSAVGSGDVNVLVEPGVRVELVSNIPESPQGDELRELVGLSGRKRFSDGYLEEISESVEGWLRERGWHLAQVETTALVEGPEGSQVRVITVRGDIGPEFIFGDLSVSGNYVLSDAEILAAFFSEADPEQRGFGTGDPELARELVQTLYQSRGYLSATASIALSEPSISIERGGPKATVDVGLTVSEGTRVLFENVTLIGGADDVAEVDLGGLVGQPVNPRTVNDLVESTGELYRDNGYLDVQVTGSLAVDGDDADLSLSVVAGPQTMIRNIVIRGNIATRTEIIEREVTLYVGDPVSLRSIDDTRRALYGLDVFSRVEVSLVGESSFTKDLLVEVVEGPRMSIELGGGVSTDMGARLFSRVTWNNVRGLGHKVSFMSEVGAGYQGDTWTLDMTAPEWRSSLRYVAPKWPVYDSEAYGDLLLNERVQENSYRLESSGLGVGLQWGFDSFVQGTKIQLSLAYRAEWRRLHDLDLGVLVVGDPWLDTLDIENLGESEVTLPSSARNQTGPELNMFFDSRDDQFNPTRGSYVSMSFRTTDPIGAGYWSYRAHAQGRSILPIGRLSFRVSGGAGVGAVAGRATTLPLEERFWLGGVSTLRGYALDRVGPKNRLGMESIDWPSEVEPLVDELGRDSTSRWVATGGDATLHLSSEVWIPTDVLGLSSNSGAVVAFVDIGNVFFVDPAVLTTSMLIDPEPLFRVGTGVGLRYRTPVGSIQVDLGVNPAWYMTEWADERGEEPVRLHIALGAT